MRRMKDGSMVRCFFANNLIKVRVKYAFEGNTFTEDVSVCVPRLITNYTPERYAVEQRIARIIAKKEAREFAVPNDKRWQVWSASIIDD